MAANNSSSTGYCLCIALMKSVILQASINNGPSSAGNMAATMNGPNPFRDFNKTIVIQSSQYRLSQLDVIGFEVGVALIKTRLCLSSGSMPKNIDFGLEARLRLEGCRLELDSVLKI